MTLFCAVSMTVFGRCSPTALMSRSKGDVLMLNNYPDVLTVKQLAEVLKYGLKAARRAPQFSKR